MKHTQFIFAAIIGKNIHPSKYILKGVTTWEKNFFISLPILLVIFACNLRQIPPEEVSNNNIIGTAIELTVQTSKQTLPEATLPTPLPLQQITTPLSSPAIAFTPTPTIRSSPTASVPMVSVSENTNCRIGPGKAYDYIGALMVGEKAEVVGKNTSRNYWIIKNPDAKGDCWLWGFYATVEGDTTNLKEYAIPPTPTPTSTLIPTQTPTKTPTITPTPPLPYAPSNLAISKTCLFISQISSYNLSLNLTWTNNPNNVHTIHNTVYFNGVRFHDVPAEQTYSGNILFTVKPNVPNQAGVSAVNTTGESPIAEIQVSCP